MSKLVLNRRSLLLGGASTALGLSLGCGSGSGVGLESLLGYVLLQEDSDIIALRPDGTGRTVLFKKAAFQTIAPDRRSIALRKDTPGWNYWNSGSASGRLDGYTLQRWGEVTESAISNVSTHSPGVWSPDSEHLLFFKGWNPLVLTVARRDGTQVLQRELTPDEQNDVYSGTQSFRWLDATTIMWSHALGTYAQTLTESTPRQLEVDYMSYYPMPPQSEGRFLYRLDNGTLVKREIATGRVTTLVTELTNDDTYRAPTLNPTGELFLGLGCHCDLIRPTTFFTLRLDVATGRVERFPLLKEPSRSLVWAPEGTRWAYTDYTDGAGTTELRIGGPAGEQAFPVETFITTPLVWL